jgi:hypothetical protein
MVELVERAITTKNIDIHIEFMEIQIKGRGGRPENSTFKRRKKDLWDIQTHLQFINEAQAMGMKKILIEASLIWKWTLNGIMRKIWMCGKTIIL